MNIYRYTFFALLAALTACSDNDFADPTTSDEISFAVSSTSSWQELSNNAAEGNAIHSRSNIPGTNYSIHSIIESNAAPDSRAAAINTGSLQEKGFNVTAVVKDKASGGASTLLMKDTPISYTGGAWTYSPVKYWPNVAQYTTTFYAYRLNDFKSQSTESDGCTPILTYTVPVDPTKQKDLIAAKYGKNDRGKVDFQLSHMLTAVKIKTHNIDRPILRIKFTGIKDSGDFHLSSMSWSDVCASGDNPNGEFKYSFVGSEWIGKPTSGTETYVTDADGNEIYFMMIPQNLADTNARVRILFENGTIIESPLKENWEAGKTVTYVVSYDSVTCQWLDDSNSYIISPIAKNNKNVNLFAIPISYRINTFWQNEGGSVKPLVGGTSYVAEVIWQDSPSRVINFTNATGEANSYTYSATVAPGGGDNEYVYFKLATPDFTGTSNVVVGVRKSGESTYLWSWHLWITDYYPLPEYQAYTLTSAARVAVPNGYIERYDDSDIAGAGAAWASLPKRYLMDRNIGAKGSCNVEITNDNYKKTFGMYYQFGRKDPFPPNGTLYRMKSDGTITNLGTLTNTDASTIVPTKKNIPFNGTESWPVVKTVQYPMEFVVSNKSNSHVYTSGNWRNPDWYAAGKDYGSKSFYDPCPPGWRVPNGTIFNIFGQKYNSKKYFQVSEENDKLKIDNQVIGYKYYIDKNQSLSTNYYIWVNRDYEDGVLLDILVNDVGNSLIWRSESFRIFQLFIHFDGLGVPGYGYTELDNTCNMECYGAQVRAIHE